MVSRLPKNERQDILKVKIPEQHTIPITGVEDPLVYYYFPIVSYFYRVRLAMALSLIQHLHFNKILDIGYGSGILFPELVKHADELYGVDTHNSHNQVKRALERIGIIADLRQGDILHLPFDDEHFDCVMCISVLEHIHELENAIAEVRRVTKKSGAMIFGFPIKNHLTSTFYSLVNFDYKTHHPQDHHAILKTLGRQTTITRSIIYPDILPLACALFCCCRCRP